MTLGTQRELEVDRPRFVRTERHPSAGLVSGARSFDPVYDSAESMEAVYATIVEELVIAAQTAGSVLYAVPGSPVVAERTVELLLDDPRVEVRLVPAMSFLDLAWTRLGVDPIGRGVRVVDGHRFAVEAAGERGPLLVAQCDSRGVLSEIKLVLDEGPEPSVDAGTEIVVLRALGLPEERITVVPWSELDRIEPDHLTSLYIGDLRAPVARELARFVEQVAVLRAECPWDREQTHESLRRHLLEEAYEVLDAIDGLDEENGHGYEHLEEELGDLLFQVLFHSQLATEAGQFTIADVATTVHDKLRDRHPHVFGGVDVVDADDVVRNWEQIKKAEKGRASVFDGIPRALPALLRALKVQKKFDAMDGRAHGEPLTGMIHISDPSGVADVEAEAGVDDGDEHRIGVELFALVDRARRLGVDPETALQRATSRFEIAARSLEGRIDG